MALPQPTIQYNPSDPLEQAGKIVSMRNLMQQGQIQQEQLTGAQQENQARAIDLQSTQAIMKAFTDAKGDPDQTVKLAAQYGAKPQHILAVQNSFIEQRKNLAGLKKDELDNAAKSADLIGNNAQAVLALPPEQRPQAIAQGIGAMASQGIIPPDAAKQLLASVPQDQAGQEQWLKFHAASAMSTKDQISAIQSQETHDAELPGKKAESIIKQNEAKYGNPQTQESRYRFVLGKMAAKQPVDPDDMAAAIAYEASNRKTTSQSDSLGVTSTNTSAPSGLAAFKKGGGGQGTGAAPAGKTVKDSIVDLVGQYRADPQLLGRMLYKHPEIVGMIQQKYPDFDQTTYVAKNKLIQGYTSGGQSKEINAINTVASHVSILNDAIDALNNGDVKLLNGIANKLGVAVGQTPQSTFKTIVHRVGPEITTAYVQGGGGEAERFANAQDFSENNAPQQLKANIAVTLKLLRGKIGALENQYKNTVGRDDFQQKFITPDAQKAFQALAPQSGGGQGGMQVGQTVKLKNGKTVKVTAVHSDGSFDAQ